MGEAGGGDLEQRVAWERRAAAGRAGRAGRARGPRARAHAEQLGKVHVARDEQRRGRRRLGEQLEQPVSYSLL